LMKLLVTTSSYHKCGVTNGNLLNFLPYSVAQGSGRGR
jgi:hypothetical protein